MAVHPDAGVKSDRKNGLPSNLNYAMMPSFKSVTHVHLLAIINTLVQDAATNSAVRVLDLGCGQGDLIAYLHKSLALLRPDIQFQVYGYDVIWGSPETNTGKANAIAKLQQEAPGTDWSQRVSFQPPSSPWPFPDAFFDIIVSNQVLEHVADHAALVAEVKRTLAPGGSSAHLFPLKNYVYEGHIFVPFVHRFENHDLAVAFLRFMHRLGFGRLDSEGKPSRHGMADAENQADWFMRFTNYRFKNEFLSLGRRAGLRVSFRFTQEFYWAKIRSLLHRAPKYIYSSRRSAILDWLLFSALKYVSGITLFLAKPRSAEDAELLLAAPSSVLSTDLSLESQLQ